MFCALKGDTRNPLFTKMRHSAVATILLPTSDPVPKTAIQLPYLSGLAPISNADPPFAVRGHARQPVLVDDSFRPSTRSADLPNNWLSLIIKSQRLEIEKGGETSIGLHIHAGV
jgi:hypothetical protein